MALVSMPNTLKMRYLRLLVALDETRGTRRAAECLGITQPGASRMVSEIETLIGFPLFDDRLPRGIEPNSLGETLIRRARLALLVLTGAQDELTAVASGARCCRYRRRHGARCRSGGTSKLQHPVQDADSDGNLGGVLAVPIRS
jgi:DNA-binding transcriptional LysR family regulator